MRDMAIATTVSVGLTLALYYLARPFFGPDAGAIVGAAFASGPFLAEYLKKRRVRTAEPGHAVDIYREAGLSWRATVAYGVLLMVGAVSAVSFIASIAERTMLAALGIIHPVVVANATAGAALPALIILYFQIGKLFAFCRGRRWSALAAVILLGPLALRAIDFLLIPQSWFDLSFPLSDRTWFEFGKFMFWTTLFFAPPVALGAWWHSRNAARLLVSSMMRLLPKDTQATVVDLVHEELNTAVAVHARPQRSPSRLPFLTARQSASLAVRIGVLILVLVLLTGFWNARS